MKLKPYPEYNDSKVEWIKEIPINWNIRKIRYLLEDHKQGFYTNQDYVDNGVKLIRITDIDDNGNVSIVNSPSVDISNAEKASFEVNNGDFLFARSGTIGRFGLVIEDFDAIFASYLIRFRFTKIINPKFIKYALLSKYFKEGLISSLHGGANQNIHAENIKEQKIIFPQNSAIQEKIVNYLDKKTSKIDLTIEKDTRLIELLKEKRTALINHVVTKGLDSTVKMKDSGVEWIGEIPEDWNNIKLKFLVNITSGEYIKNDDLSSNGRYEVFGGNGFLGRADLYNVDDYALIVGRVGAKCGNVRLTTGKKWVSDNALVLKTDQNYFYMLYLLQNLNLNNLANKNAQPLITSTQVKNSIVILPPKEIQEQLIQYLNKELSKIELIIEKIKIKVNLLEEYKKSLIHHVVTGKVDVREVAV